MSRRIASLVVLLLAAPALAERPPGEVIESAVAVDVTQDGLNAFLPIADDFIPPGIEMPVVVETSTFPAPFAGDNCGGPLDVCYEYSVTNLDATLELIQPTITPGNGVIELATDLRVTVNDEFDPLAIYLRGGYWGIDLDTSCNAWIDPVDIPISAQIQIDYNTFSGQLQADLLPISYDVSALNSDSVQLEDCGLETLNTIAGYVGVDLIQLAIDAIIPILDDQITSVVDDLNDQIQPILDDVVVQASVATTVDVLGVPIDIDVAPEDVEITSDGVRLLMAGSIDAPSDPCVEGYGITGSLETVSDPDPIGTAPGGIPVPHVAVQADDDLVNQGLFAAWNGGLLCWTVDNSMEGLPIAIDTNLLNLLAPNIFDDLFPENAELVLQTSPRQPPTATLDGANDVDIHVEELGLDFYADLDGRRARIMEVSLAADAGANVGFDGTAGEVGLAIDFDTSAIQASITFNELRPEANAEIASSLLGIVDTLAGPALEGLLADQTFAIPAIEGYGLSSANILPAPGAPDRLGIYGNIGAVTYANLGDEEGGGCDSLGAGCGDSSCDSSRAGGRVALFAFPLLLAVFRRRA